MLQTQTVEPNTLSLLNKLMKLPQLKNFSLVGGTALSLRYGHRISIDLDLFSNSKFDSKEFITVLQNEFKEDFELETDAVSFGIFCFINNIKVDIVYYPHPVISDLEIVDDIRMYSDADICAMKINAILGRGKKKDFWDLSELLKHYSLAQIIEWHKQKFPNQFLLISIPQAISYFNDADESEDPVSLNGETWESIKKNIGKAVRDFLK